MKFAFSSLAAPHASFASLVGWAKEFGFDGVELCALPGEPAEVRGVFESAGVEVACLASSIAMAPQRRKRAALAAEVRIWIDAAQRLGCRWVKILDTRAAPGETGNSAAVELAGWLLPLADYAAERGVTLVVENALSFRKAREVWMLLESIDHPNVAACWDVFNAAQAGESPYVSVPSLNSRIQYARVKEVQATPQGAQYCKLGEGEIPVQSFITRLRGIGYAGYVTIETAEGLLSDSIIKLRHWAAPTAVKTAAPRSTPARTVAVLKRDG